MSTEDDSYEAQREQAIKDQRESQGAWMDEVHEMVNAMSESHLKTLHGFLTYAINNGAPRVQLAHLMGISESRMRGHFKYDFARAGYIGLNDDDINAAFGLNPEGDFEKRERE